MTSVTTSRAGIVKEDAPVRTLETTTKWLNYFSTPVFDRPLDRFWLLQLLSLDWHQLDYAVVRSSEFLEWPVVRSLDHSVICKQADWIWCYRWGHWCRSGRVLDPGQDRSLGGSWNYLSYAWSLAFYNYLLSPARNERLRPTQSGTPDAVLILFSEEALMRNFIKGLSKTQEDGVGVVSF